MLQMSDRNGLFPLLAVLDLLHQKQILSSLKVRFSVGFGTGNSSLCGTGLIGKSEYFHCVCGSGGDPGYVSITDSNVQSNPTCLTNIFIDLGLHVSIQ